MDYSYTYKNRNSSTRNLRPQTIQPVDASRIQKKGVQFHTDVVYLEQRLFDPIRPKLGPKTILNTTVLPDYLAYIKQQLTATQKTVLSDYHFQNLLMEYAFGSQNINLYQIQPDNNADPNHIKKKSNMQSIDQFQQQQENGTPKNKLAGGCSSKVQREPLDTLEKLTNAILKYVRSKNEYWFKKSKQVQVDEKQRQHHAIETYQTHMKEICNMQSKYLDMKRSQMKDYQIFVPEIQLHAEQTFKLKKISSQYRFQNYGSLSIRDNSSSNHRRVISCTLFPWIIEYVVKGVRMQQKVIKDDQKQISNQMEQEIQKIEQQKQQCLQNHIQDKQMAQQRDQQKNQQGKVQNQEDQQEQQLQEDSSSSQSYRVIYQFYQTNEQYPNQKIIQMLRQCLIYFSVRQKCGAQNSNESLYTSLRDQFSAINSVNNKKTHITFAKWLTKQQGLSKSTTSIVNRQWIFFTNLLKIIEKVYDLSNKHSQQQFQDQKYSDVKVNTNQQLDFGRKIISESQLCIFADKYLRQYHQTIKYQVAQTVKQQKDSISIFQRQASLPSKNQTQFFQRYSIFGVNSFEQIAKIKQKFQTIISSPTNQQLSRYKVEQSQIPWQEDHYKYFLKFLVDYIYLPTNNRKIAIQMSKIILANANMKIKSKNKSRQNRNSSKKSQQLIIEPNHVKWVKGIYFRNMTRRIDNGECGGGKRGKILNKQQFIKRDLQNFNMKYFKRTNNRNTQPSKSRKRKSKKRKSFYDYSSDSQQLIKELQQERN